MIPKYIAYEYNNEGVLNRPVFIAEDDRLSDYVAFYKEVILPNQAPKNMEVGVNKVDDATIIADINAKPSDFEDPKYTGPKARTHIVRLDHRFMV